MVKKRGGGRPRIPLLTENLGNLEDKLPPRPIVLEQVLYWMDLGAPAADIAGSFHVSVDTLDRRLREHTNFGFAELKEKCCGSAKLKLRNNQFKLSEKNATMAIWLGKIWLGQRDPQFEEAHEEAANALRYAIKEVIAESRNNGSGGSILEDQQSLLHQRCGGEEDQIPNELGSEDSLGGEAHL